MKIAQLVSNHHPVSLTFNKAIYSHVAWLTDGLINKGHEVHLFASSDSDTKAHLHSTSPALSSLDMSAEDKKYKVFENISNCYETAGKNQFDIIHSHFNLLSSFFARLVDMPTVVSIHSPIEDRLRPFLERYKTERYISFSLAQRKQMPELNWYANIYHGVDMDLFNFESETGDYLLYLGRITEDKGVHHAIEAAKAVGLPLRIAGGSYQAEGYWQKMVEPHINGESVRYFGEVELENKIKLLQGAKALLFPTQCNEVFGYVMIEAMACGTPVIGFNNGSVPEIIQDGLTGFVVEDAGEMIEAIKKLDQIDRQQVRKRAEIYFSVNKMVSGYQKVYERIIRDAKFKKDKTNGN